jgi:ATP-dependent DNA ligase
MLATAAAPAGDRAAWAWECKWDGWRKLVYVDQSLRVRTRRGRPIGESLLALVGPVDTLGSRTAILDGELVASPAGAVRARLIRAAVSPTLKLLWRLPTQSGSKVSASRS